MTHLRSDTDEARPVSAGHIDLYQLTSLIPHWDAGKAHAPCWMSFFSRRLPRTLNGQTARPYLVWAGLQRCLEHLEGAHFTEAQLETLCAHPVLGKALKARPKLIQTLKAWRFKGEVWGAKEGTLIWAHRAEGEIKGDLQPSASLPYLQVRCDVLTAKLIETPLLSIINHMSMVATKSAQLCEIAKDRSIFEFGSRRTHIEAAVDAAYAAYIGGTVATSNVEAHHRYGIPVVGTMDHFAVQAWEQDGLSVAETERAFFKAFYETFPEHASLLIDTYDPFGEETGIRNAVIATNGKLKGIRLDSMLSVETITKARQLLDELGASEAQIIASGGIDFEEIITLRNAPVDAFGVGERLVSSADAPVGVGAVGKLSSINGQVTMKQAKGTGKATLPGPLQCYRSEDHDRLTLLNLDKIEACQPGEQALVTCLWLGVGHPRPSFNPEEIRAYVKSQQEVLQNRGDHSRKVILDPSLIDLINQLVTRSSKI